MKILLSTKNSKWKVVQNPLKGNFILMSLILKVMKTNIYFYNKMLWKVEIT